MRAGWVKAAVAVVVLALIGGLAFLGMLAWSAVNRQPSLLDDQCRATAGGATVTLTPEQARNAAIISAVGLARGLPARAVTIALATAYQESGIRNLDYGHADSIGLFQQRPSMGWGTVRQIMDPYYSSRQFYAALVKVKGWRTGDVNDVAQAVQRSGHPEAYRKHVGKAQALAAALTGVEPAGFTCTTRSPKDADPDASAALLRKALRDDVTVATAERGLVVTAQTAQRAWAAAQLVVAHSGVHGVAEVTLGEATWKHDAGTLAPWTGRGSGRIVTVGFSS